MRQCGEEAHSNGENDGADSCQCDTYFKWDSQKNDCVMDCGKRVGETVYVDEE